jgi:hypothetical protein
MRRSRRESPVARLSGIRHEFDFTQIIESGIGFCLCRRDGSFSPRVGVYTRYAASSCD